MTEAERAILAQYVRERADELGLRDWVIELSRDEPGQDDALAVVEAITGRKKAVVKVCPDFRALSPAEQRNTIIHELLHCHLWPIEEVGDSLDVALSHGQWMQHKGNVHLAVEYACDGLATAIDELFDLVPWPVPEG